MTGARIRNVVLLVLLIAGLVPRVLALSSPQRVAASISEDGYLMLTVARNVADGRGLSTAAGTMPTNGVQPLVTFIWAGVHAVTADDAAALRVVVLIELLTAVVGAFLVGGLAGHFFRGHPDAATISRVTAALWFASPIVIRHTLNGLETGAYAACIAGVLLLDARWRERRTLGHSAAIGMLLGAVVLVRNDAALLVAAYTLVVWLAPVTRRGLHGAGDGPHWGAAPTMAAQAVPGLAGSLDGAGGEAFGRRLGHAVVVGLAAVVTASPWLAFNVTRFGHIVPISGRSQSLGIALGENLVKLPRTLVEYALAGLPLPDSVQVLGPWTVALAGAALCVAVTAWRGRRSLGLVVDRPLGVLLLFTAGLAAYYGTFFAAGHFLSRYLFPLSLFTVALAVSAVVTLARRLPVIALGGAGVLAAALLTADARFALRADRHPHMQVVEWVRANVAETEWLAAPQSGTVGYFHDRTINLDGKVNPDALRARIEGRLFAYIVDGTEARYLADWYGLARWIDDPASVKDEHLGGLLARHFRFRVKDAAANLVVLERIPRTPADN